MIHVAAAVLENGDGRILLAQRPDGGHLAGLWEFPGGKVEAGETTEAALRRELHEELGVSVTNHSPLLRVRHRYPEREVLLDVYRAQYDGAPHGREGQALAWVALDDLDDYAMPVADRPIVNALRLPSLYRFTPPDMAPTALSAMLREAGSELPGMVQLRVFGLDPEAQREMAEEAVTLCRSLGIRLLINADGALAQAVGADGVHLNSRQLLESEDRPLGEGYLCAASCHTENELRRAAALGFDFAVLSPVLPTPSHPDAEPLGWSKFEHLAREAGLPVYALGGMRHADLERARRAGAQGLAGIRGLWPEIRRGS